MDHRDGPDDFCGRNFQPELSSLWDPWPVGLDYPVIGHYWTLALEEQFYLTWPLLMFLFARRKLVATLTGFIVIAPLIRVATYFLAPDSRPQIGMMFHTAFDSVAAGVLLGELMRNPETRAKLQNLAGKRSVLAVALLYPSSSLRFSSTSWSYSDYDWQERSISSAWDSPHRGRFTTRDTPFPFLELAPACLVGVLLLQSLRLEQSLSRARIRPGSPGLFP